MVQLYHGSYNMFDRFDPNAIKKTEYGHGFYASDYGGDCLEYMSEAVYGDKPGYMYEFEVPDQAFQDRWLKSSEPAVGPQIDRLIATLREDGNDKLADRIENDPHRDFDPATAPPDQRTTQAHVMSWIGKGADKTDFYRRAGIDGYHEGNYYCLYPHAEMGEFTIKQAFNVPQAEAEASLQGLQERRATREMEGRVLGELDAAREESIAHIRKSGHTATMGINEAGAAYSSYDSHEDRNKYRAQDRVTLRFGQDQDGSLVVYDIERDGKKADLAFKAQEMTSTEPEDRLRIADRVYRPKSAEIAGVKYEVGGPAEGRVTNEAEFSKPENQAARDAMTDNYFRASFSTINFNEPKGRDMRSVAMAAGQKAEAQPARPRL